ncbi:MBL fold metallo-hydrolase [Microbacterium sp. CFBP9034]|uniref:MBL fold metallo-hydrolase n=1 Tax=Microbacterium sp. CFBP9034 TaxID=3096540 RepID=UPI002A6AFA33|nr:MBL fold metallo-hydrolase [Microbacterium sp. CFBP9034]MDY0908236.1 MBL fold metallo-hydrolase [Microbacterium sp. CFBP9034]
MELRPGLHRIVAPLGERFIAMYLLEGPEGALLFDTGIAESVPGTLIPYLEGIGFDLSRLRWVVSSHCDFDHTGGNAALAAVAPGAQFLAGSADVAMTEDVEELIRGRYGEFADDDGFDDPPATTAFVRASTGLVRVDRALAGGEDFDLGDRVVQVLAAPGHSPGHLALWDAGNSSLLISDAVLGETVPTAAGDPAFPPTYRDTAAYVETIARLRALRAELLLTAHYPIYEGAAVDAFLDESLAYTELIDAVIEDALRDAGALTTRELIERTAGRLGAWSSDAAAYLIFPLTGNLERLVAGGAVAVGRRDGLRTWRWVAA